MSIIRTITSILKDVDNTVNTMKIRSLKKEVKENRFYYKEYQYIFAIEHIDIKLNSLSKCDGVKISTY